jgi:hypothetical protein
MRNANVGLVIALFSLGACAAPDVNGSDLGSGPVTDGNTSGGKKPGDNSAGSKVVDDPGATDPSPTTPTPSSTTVTPTLPIVDSDHDGVPDDVDCAPNDATIAGTTLLKDDLTTDKNLFAPATGFPADWSYSAGYVQTRLADAPDQTLLLKDAAVTNAIVEVTAASTEISSGITPILRQMFITFGTQVSGGTLTAVGCGLEVDASQTPTQKTSVVRLSGSATNVTSTPLNRVDRGAVQANEEFKMKGVLQNGTLTCTVTIGGTTTTTATASVGQVTGSIGFFTKQTKALFKQASVCKLK